MLAAAIMPRVPLLLSAALLPVMVLATIVVLLVTRNEMNDLEVSTRAQAQQTLQIVDRELSAHLRVLEALATSQTLDEGDFEHFYLQAERFQNLDPLWQSVLLAAPGGERILSTSFPFGTELGRVIERASHDQVVQTKRPLISGITAPGFRDARVILLRVPVLRDGEVAYVLSAAWSPKELGELVRRDLPPGWFGVVGDREGLIIARTSDGDLLAGQPLSDSARKAVAAGHDGQFRHTSSRDGGEFAAVFVRSALTGWTIHVGFPYSTFSILENRSVLYAGLGGASAILLASFLSVLLYRDLIARRKVEAELAHAERMDALGQLTGGVAHDFNNLLAVITGSLSLELRHAEAPTTRRRLNLALEAAQRGAALTRQLLAFARRAPLQPEPLDISQHLSHVRLLIEGSLRQDIALRIEHAPEIWPVEVDPQQLDLTLVNLATNARDAMPEGGVLRLSLRNARLPDEAGSDALNLSGEFVRLSVADTGKGMDAETAQHAFEPFFTTKGPGKGTGLGLSHVYGFAKQAGGTAVIRSRPGAGTVVEIYLPRARRPLPAKVAPEVRKPAATQPLRILVVEDDAAVAEVTEGLLRQLGHTTVVVSRAEQALDRLRGDPSFDLVFSDIVMPGGMDGLKLAAVIRAQFPDLPVLLTSGYAIGSAEDSFSHRVLRKPYHPTALDEAIQACMAEAGRTPTAEVTS